MSNDNYISSYSGSQVDNVLGLFHGKGLDQVTGLVQRNADGTFSVGSGGESDVFIATYGTTTYSDLLAAISANKIIVVIYNSKSWVSYSFVTTNDYIFLLLPSEINTDDKEFSFMSFKITNKNVWSFYAETDEYQSKLVSGTNIKTINNTSLLGSGNIDIQGGASNWLNGSATGSVKTVYSAPESDSYTIGNYAVAEGSNTKASGNASHAQNYYTIAAKSYQTAIGKYNIEDTETTENLRKAFIIGNGSADNDRSNALTVDWQGNVDIASGASYKINGTPLSANDVGAQPVLTAGTGISIQNNVISVNLPNAEGGEF